MGQFLISDAALQKLYSRIKHLEDVACQLQCCCCPSMHDGCDTYTFEQVIVPGNEQVQAIAYEFFEAERDLNPLNMVVTLGEPFRFDLNWMLVATYPNGSQTLIASGVIPDGFLTGVKDLTGENSIGINSGASLALHITAPNDDLNVCMGCGLSATLFAMSCPDVSDTTDCEACVDLPSPPCQCSVFDYGTL